MREYDVVEYSRSRIVEKDLGRTMEVLGRRYLPKVVFHCTWNRVRFSLVSLVFFLYKSDLKVERRKLAEIHVRVEKSRIEVRSILIKRCWNCFGFFLAFLSISLCQMDRLLDASQRLIFFFFSSSSMCSTIHSIFTVQVLLFTWLDPIAISLIETMKN